MSKLNNILYEFEYKNNKWSIFLRTTVTPINFLLQEENKNTYSLGYKTVDLIIKEVLNDLSYKDNHTKVYDSFFKILYTKNYIITQKFGNSGKYIFDIVDEINSIEENNLLYIIDLSVIEDLKNKHNILSILEI